MPLYSDACPHAPQPTRRALVHERHGALGRRIQPLFVLRLRHDHHRSLVPLVDRPLQIRPVHVLEQRVFVGEKLWRLLVVSDPLGPAARHNIYKAAEVDQAPGFELGG